MSNVIVNILKLVTGEEIISEVVIKTVTEGDGEGQQIINLVNPCRISSDMQDDGVVNAGFVPLAIFYQDETVQLAGDKIVWTGIPVESMLDIYLTRFGHKVIETPPEKKLIVPGK